MNAYFASIEPHREQFFAGHGVSFACFPYPVPHQPGPRHRSGPSKSTRHYLATPVASANDSVAFPLVVSSAWRPTPRERRFRASSKKLESACKPGSVEDDHSSGIAVTGDLKRPTRKRRGTPAATCVATSLFGLAPGGVCRAAECCHRRGALLPHRFTLTVVIADA